MSLVALVATVAASSCEDHPVISAVPTASSATTANVGAGGAGGSAGQGASGGGTCAPQPVPPGVPAGWEPYDDWSCDCLFYVPGSKDVLPEPIAWESCPDLGDGVACQSMVVDWTDDHAALAYNPLFTRDADGNALLSFTRSAVPISNTLVIAEPDGSTRAGFVLPIYNDDPKLNCVAGAYDAREGKHLIRTRGLHAAGPPTMHLGALGGSIDDLRPKLLLEAYENGSPYTDGWAVSAQWVFQLTFPFELRAWPWSMTAPIVVHKPSTDPDGISASQPLPIGDALFFTTGTLQISGINVWDSASGTRAFRRWPGDYTRGAGNLGTDGTHMVWSEGEGKAPSEELFPIRHIMTAPFTTDPAALQPTRLRSQPSKGLGEAPWQVGCGYAAHSSGSSQIMVVRISDGWSWQIPNSIERGLTMPLGLTCDELFAAGTVGEHWTIARVRLDSLGPGTAPD